MASNSVITNPTNVEKFFASFSTGTPVPRNSRPPFWLAKPEKKGGLELSVNGTTKLGKFNRVHVVINNKADVLSADKIAGLLLKVKTLYGLAHPVTISNYRQVTDITTNITKVYKTQVYKKQNKVVLTGSVSQGKANLFGWIPTEDGPVYDKYVCQPTIDPYSKTVVSIDPIITETGLELIFIKDLLVPTHKYYNLCKDNAIVEKYMSYELKLDSAVIFHIKQYYATGTTGLELSANDTYKRTVISLECEFNEESRVLPEKIANITAYIDNICYILTND